MVTQTNASDMMHYSFMLVFANDGIIDINELHFLEQLAVEDGEVDHDEKVMLTRIFSRVNQNQVTDEVWQEIQDFRTRFNF